MTNRFRRIAVLALALAAGCACAPLRTDTMKSKCEASYNACLNSCVNAHGMLGREVAQSACVNGCNGEANACESSPR